jgi:two-component sensor histidine kinase
VAGAPTRRGFGTVLAERSVAGQLDGTLEHDWNGAGLVMRLTVPAANLAA